MAGLLLPSFKAARRASWQMSTTTRRILILASLCVSLYFLLPFSVHAFLESIGLKQSRKATILITLGASMIVCGCLGWAMQRDLARARIEFIEARRKLALRRASFKCVTPQVFGQFVVFPVRVDRRGQKRSRIVALDELFLRVELRTNHDAGADSASALKELLQAELLPRFNNNADIVTFQGKDAGPTGLAAGLALKGPRRDPSLGVACGRALMDLATRA